MPNDTFSTNSKVKSMTNYDVNAKQHFLLLNHFKKAKCLEFGIKMPTWQPWWLYQCIHATTVYASGSQTFFVATPSEKFCCTCDAPAI